MGAGSSRKNLRVVATDSVRVSTVQTNNNIEIKGTNAENHGEVLEPTESQNEDMEDRLTSGKGNVKTVAVSEGLAKLKEQIATTIDDEHNRGEDVGEDESSMILTSFIEKNPKLEEALKKTRDHYKGLKEAFANGILATEEVEEHIKGLFSGYTNQHKPAKAVLTDFTVRLGLPKLAYDIITDRRNNCPELTKWDRETSTEKQPEENEASANTEKTESEKNDKKTSNPLELLQDNICLFLGALLNYSDLHDEFCLECNEVGMVQLFVEMSKELQDSIPHNVKYVEPKTQRLKKFTVRGKMLSRSLGTLHNFSKRVPTRANFASAQAVNSLLLPLLKAEITFYSAKSLLILAYLIDEQNNHLIMADEEPINFLIRLLRKAIETDYHRYLGFSARELAEGLTQIAINDNNKKTIVRSGAIPILVKMLENAKDDEERVNACNTLWTLAFDEENKKEIKKDAHASAELQKLLTSTNNEVKKAAAGALWEIEGKEKHAEDKQQSVKESDAKHVMISYQWDVQKLVIQIKNKLQADGFKVWMDIDEMGGSTLESMAKAVENASVILVCVSQKYKESPNCRSEAEYTYQLHKDIIPLMMDGKYRPDGWLGFIVGSKFWIDFSEKHKLDSNVSKLVKELGTRGKIELQENTMKATVLDVVDASPQSTIRSWTCSDVKTWLKNVGLRDRLDSNTLKRLNGQILLRLQDLRRECPEFFYSSVRTDFKLDTVFDVLEFVDALDKLVE
ncbi:myosin-7 [Pocillopora verrucosa]|uniref:myosin-7 n=1 Tax=Pocillopora verrucosa TaxID=203993 RepID=UPI00333F8AD2